MMTIKRAISHFRFKLNPKNKIWKATENDVEAINTIMDFVEQKHKQQYNDNQLFAKLYIKYYGELLRYYKADVFSNIPQKELHKILDTPIEQLIKDFVKTAQDVEQANEMKINGVLRHPKIDVVANNVVYESWSEEQRESMQIVEPPMTEEEATKNLVSMINLAINEFNG